MLFRKITLILLTLVTSILAVDWESRKIHIGDTIKLANSNHADGGYKVTKIRWLENGKVMTDINGNLMDSRYKRYSYYKPTLEGRHTYTRETTKRLDDSKGRPYNKIYTKIINFDVFGLDQEILELKTKPSYSEITLGQELTLEGIVTKGSLNNVAEYSWSENNIILKDTQGKDIVYHDDDNRWHEYKATAIGDHNLYFTVKDINGYKYKTRMVLSVKDNYVGLLVDAGKDKNITSAKRIYLGTIHDSNYADSLTVNGTVLRGNIDDIAKYTWSEKGKELATYGTAGNSSEQVTLGVGKHTLTFSAHHDNGRVYTNTMILTINSNDNSVVLLDAGINQTIQLDSSITLNGKVIQGDKNTITEYVWKENGNILNNLLGDPILYNDYENRDNDYKPNKVGKHTLTFSATDSNSKVYEDSIILTVKEKGDTSDYTLNAGKNQTIQLGNSITLNGKIVNGDKSEITEYAWSEKSKILKNLLGDPILYIDYENRENDYNPQKIGQHTLTFSALHSSGKYYHKDIIITVTPKSNPIYKLKVAKKTTITLGEMITLNGKITKGNKNNIETYLWKENGKTLNNAVGDPIEYIDYENRDNDYIPTTIGKHTLTFKVITKDGETYTKQRTVIVKNK